MVRGSLKAGLILTIVPATATCLGFELVAPAAREPRAQVTVMAVQGDSVHAVLDISLDVGTDTQGRPFTLEDPGVLVNRGPIEPVDAPVNGGYRYLALISLTKAEALAQLELTLTIARDPVMEPVHLRIPFVLRSDTTDIVLLPGEDLILNVDTEDLGSASRVDWSVELKTSCNLGLRFGFLGGSSAPPGRLVVARAIVGDSPPSAFAACMSSRAIFEMEAGPTRPAVRLNVTTQTQWGVRLEASGPRACGEECTDRLDFR